MSYDKRGNQYGTGSGSGSSGSATSTPGKATLTSRLPVQRKARDGAMPGNQSFVDSLVGSPVQCDGQDGSSHPDAQSIAAGGLTGSSTGLPYADQIQASFGRHSIAGVDAHIGGPAAEASAALGAHAYATGSSVAFGRSPDLHTAAHEAAHVIQQRAGVHLKGGLSEIGDTHERHADAVADAVVHGKSAEPLLDQYSGSGGGGNAVQLLTETRAIPGGRSSFDIDMRPVNSPATQSGLDGFIRFVPGAGDKNSNTIAFHQIIKTTNVTAGVAPDTDIDIGTLPPDRNQRGALGDRGIRTQANATTGVEGGFHTDVHHRNSAASPSVAAGDPLLPRYNFQPAAPGTNTGQGATPQPAKYGAGVGGRVGQTPGFKRSDLPEDIKSAAMYDFPGAGGTGFSVDFEFQSVARGEDTQHDYGSVNWGFRLAAGAVSNEHFDVVAGASATFHEAEDRHYDFYVHEPVTIYFAFDRANVDATENAKITGFAGYLARNPKVQMTLDGFADLVGDPAYNVGLSERRVTAVRNAITAAHPTVPAAQIVSNTVVAGHANAGGHGESTAANDGTSQQPAGTGDQGGNAANGADPDREANRQFNRRVTITFSHPAGTGPGAPGGRGGPPAAPAAGP